MVGRLGILPFAALLIGANSPTAGKVEIHHDWAVGCDNQRNCAAVSLGAGDPVEGPFEDPIAIIIYRGGAGTDRVAISVSWPDEQGPYTLSLDGEKIDIAAQTASGFHLKDDPQSLRGGPAGRMLAKIHQGRWLELHNSSGKMVLRSSLRGLEAAMLHMDIMQQRLETETALENPGPRSPDRIRQPQPVMIDTPRRSALPAAALPSDLKDKVARDQECGAGEVDLNSNDLVVKRLDVRTTLALVPWPCGNGHYNVWSEAFLIDNSGKARSAPLEVLNNQDTMSGSSLVNPVWDDASAQLSSFARGRAWGDCGTQTTYVWDGKMFRILTREEMPVCRNSEDFITVWSAKIRRTAKN